MIRDSRAPRAQAYKDPKEGRGRARSGPSGGVYPAPALPRREGRPHSAQTLSPSPGCDKHICPVAHVSFALDAERQRT
jgi:hypothetical protein